MSESINGTLRKEVEKIVTSKKEQRLAQKKKYQRITILIATVVAIGIALGGYSLYAKWIFPLKLNTQFSQLVEANSKQFFQDNIVIQEQPIVQLDQFKVLQFIPTKTADIEAGDVLGGLYIPSTNTKLPIVRGASLSYASSAAVTIQQDVIFGEGNVVLGAHSTKDKNILFTSLRNIEEGADIHITDKNEIYLYVVEKRLHVRSGREDLTYKRNDPTLTLVTGYDNEKNEQIVIQAKLVTSDVYAAETAGQLLDVFGH